MSVWFILAAVGLFGWALLRLKANPAATGLLWLAWFGVAAAYHSVHRNSFGEDDIGRYAGTQPILVRVRGIVDEEPILSRTDRSDPFIPARKPDRGMTILAVSRVRTESGEWISASGNARLIVDRAIDPDAKYALDEVHVGDEVEVTAMISAPAGPSNPGERDYAASERDKRITAEMRIAKATESIVRLDRRGDWNWHAWVASARGRAARTLRESMPAPDAAVARALLLGDGTAMNRSEWDAYIRTGVVHVLAISGQHLVVLAGSLWFLFRVIGVRRRYGACAVMAIVIGYAILTGLRPSAVRAVIMVCGMCWAFVLRRPVNPANVFALSWIAVAAADPTDPFSLGCQLSFLAVFVLIWGVTKWVPRGSQSPLERLIDESRPPWIRTVRKVAKGIGALYFVTIILFAATGPVLVDRQNVLSPVGVLIGPVLILMTEIALVTGFITLLVGSVSLTLAFPFAVVTKLSLGVCGAVVRAADRFPGGTLYGPGPPVWWQVGFFLGLVAVVLLTRPWPRRIVPGLAGWVVLGVLVTGHRTDPDELRVTFLSVGHGTCAVLECPDGRVLLYDLGTMAGPDAVRRTVAPFLWYRGIGSVDEVFLSHADTDHFNGLPEFLRRFPVGKVTLTPSFAEKPIPEVAAVLAALQSRGVERRIAVAGDRFEAGGVAIDVLHPPPVGPGTTENERSLVLLVAFAGRGVLLTGDLEKSGTARVVRLPAPSADVVMAPHHGSRSAFGRDFQDWAKPKFVVVSKGYRDTGAIRSVDLEGGAVLWDTPAYGAVTVRIHRTGVVVEAFKTGERIVIDKGR
jgi:competence protein ComEC